MFEQKANFYELIEGKKIYNYDQSCLSFGKSEIKIENGQNTIDSNFALKGYSFNCNGHKVNDFLG